MKTERVLGSRTKELLKNIYKTPGQRWRPGARSRDEDLLTRLDTNARLTPEA